MADSPAVRRADLVGTSIGRFVVLAQLGAGGMGEVFRARDTKLNRTVALKRLHIPDSQSGARSRLLAEGERACRVNHPNVATVYDVIEEGDDVLLIMEYVEGQTLRSRLNKAMSVDEAVVIAAQCAEALAAAHKHGVIHCDIKPENVMLTAEGGVKLLDFGIARNISTPDNATWASRTSTNTFSGTPAYMSPEVLNEQPPDARSDVFSLGVVLYEMLSGENPFQTGVMIETANRVLHRDPPSLTRIRPQVSEQLSRIVAHAIEKQPDERYASAGELARDLRAIIAGQPQLVIAPAHRRKRRYLDIVAPIVVAIALVAAGALLWRYFGPRPTTTPQSRLVAVLPFAVNSDDRTAHAFSDGLVETLSAKLSRISDGQSLQVIPAWEVRSQGVTTPEQAVKALGVNLVIEGSTRQIDQNVRVTYALVDPRTKRQIKGDAVTAVMANPFDVEDKVVDSVLSSLEVELKPQQREALNAGRTTEPGAYDFYLQGRGYLQDYHKQENLDSAITVFQRALQADSKFGLGYAGLGEAYWLKWQLLRQSELAQSAKNACEQAVSLSPEMAGGHICLGMVFRGTGKYDDAVKQFQQALSQEPNNDHALAGLGGALERMNRLPEAEQAFQKGVAVHPSYWAAYSQLGAFYYRHARYPSAIDAFKKATELTPDNFRTYNSLAGVYLATGDYKNAAAASEKSFSIRPTAEGYSNAATAYFFQHRYADSAKVLEQAVTMLPNRFDLWLNLAESSRWAGDVARTKTAAAKAASLAEDAVKMNDKDSTSWSELAYAYSLLHEAGKAKNAINKAVTLAPADQNVLLFAALASRELGDTPAAASYVNRALHAGLSASQIKDHPALADLKLQSK